MARAARQTREEPGSLLSSYMRALARSGGSGTEVVGPGHQVRVCPNCGERAIFRTDPAGGWSVCTNCSELA